MQNLKPVSTNQSKKRQIENSIEKEIKNSASLHIRNLSQDDTMLI